MSNLSLCRDKANSRENKQQTKADYEAAQKRQAAEASTTSSQTTQNTNSSTPSIDISLRDLKEKKLARQEAARGEIDRKNGKPQNQSTKKPRP